MKATVTWTKEMLFVGHPPSGHPVPMDAAAVAGGSDSAPRPMELLLVALGGCTGMDVISILRKKRLAVTSLETELDAEQDEEHPRKFKRIGITYRVSGEGLDEGSVRRAIELSREKYCSVAATLSSPVTVDWRLEPPPAK